MKKILLLLLVPIAIGSMYIACSDQKKKTTGNENTKEKWVINRGDAKSDNGELFVDLPKDTKWDMTIYAAGNSKVLSNTMLQTSFTLPPGRYDLEINHIWIKEVPVEKGNKTRLKTGVLHIKNKTPWTLYDESNKPF